MDNLARHYAGRFREAEYLAAAGNTQEALDICLQLRLRPDLGIYRRATVNLLISMLVHEKNRVVTHANECLDLLSILRAERNVDEETLEKELTPIEELARRVLQQSESTARLPTPEEGEGQSDTAFPPRSEGEDEVRAQPAPDSAAGSFQIEGYLRDEWVMNQMQKEKEKEKEKEDPVDDPREHYPTPGLSSPLSRMRP